MPQRGEYLEMFFDQGGDTYRGPEGVVPEQDEPILHAVRWDVRAGQSWLTGRRICVIGCKHLLTTSWCVGTERYWIMPIDASGLYNGDPSFIDITMATPPGHTDAGSQDESGGGWTGTLTGLTESSGELVLPNGVTAGSYESGAIDFGAVAIWRVGICSDVTYTNDGIAWPDMDFEDLPDDLTFDESFWNFEDGPPLGDVLARDDAEELYTPKFTWTMEWRFGDTLGELALASYVDHQPGLASCRYAQFRISVTRTDDDDDLRVANVVTSWSRSPLGDVPSISVPTDIIAVGSDPAGTVSPNDLGLSFAGTIADGNLLQRDGTTIAPTGFSETDLRDASFFTAGTLADARVAESNVTQHEGAIDHDALSGFVAAEHIDWTATGAEDVHDDRIAASSVTQHVGSIDHDSLLNYDAAEHRTINDAGSGTTDLWSADKIGTELDSKADASHTHAVTDLDDISTGSIVGRDTAGTGSPEVLTATQARGILNVEDGAQVNVVDSVHGRTGDVIAAVDDYAFSQIGSVPEARLLGRTTAGTGVTEALTATAARSFLNVEDGAEANDVDSVFGRTGAVVAASGDYDADEVTYDNTTSGLTATEVQSAIDEIVAASGVVTSVHGRTGDVVAVEGDYDINELGDVSGLAASQTLDLSTSGANEALMSDGSGSFAARALEAFDIASGAFVDARISESSVTQHEAAIDHNALANYSAENHRTINDGATSTTGLWSSTKISTELTGKADASHTHTAEEVEYDNATSGLTASDVQAALDEIDSNVDAITVPTISVPTSVIAVGSDPTGTVVDSDLGLTTETGRNGIAIGDVSALPDITTDLSVSVTGATNATPIVITTASAHGLHDGAIVTVSGVGGNTAANGVFVVTYDSDTTLELDNSAGNGAYTSGGTLISGTATVTAYGTDNLTIGYGAGEDVTTWALLGSQVLIGRDAGKGHSGGSVLSIGIESGLYQEGWLSTFVGHNAGKYSIKHPGEGISGQVGTQGTAGPQYLIAVGGNAGTFNAGAFCTAVGGYAGNTVVADNNGSFGWRAGRQSAGWNSNWFGLRTGENNMGPNNTGVGHRAFREFTSDTPNAKTFDAADVTIGTDVFTDPGTITILSHGFGSVGQYVNLRVTKGPHPENDILPSPLLQATTQNDVDEQIDLAQFLIIDANTLQAHGFLISDAGAGEDHTLTPKVVYENSSALGAYAEPDASNQVMLGDTDVTQVKSSGAFRSTSTDPSALDGALSIVDYLTIAPTLGANSVSINPATQTVGDGTLTVPDLEGTTQAIVATNAVQIVRYKQIVGALIDATTTLDAPFLSKSGNTNPITIEALDQSIAGHRVQFRDFGGTADIHQPVTSSDFDASFRLIDASNVLQSGMIMATGISDTDLLTLNKNQTSAGTCSFNFLDMPTGAVYAVATRSVPTSGENGYVPVVRSVSGKYMYQLEPQAGGGASELNDLSDVDLTSIATNDLLQYDGSNVVNVSSIAGTQVSYDPTGNSYVSGSTAEAAIDWIDLVFGVVQATHIGVSQGVHGLGGGDAVVGTIKTQTLTNKTLTSPTINGAAINDPDLADVIEMTLDDSGSATISSGVVAYNGIYMTVEAETGTSDTLDRISGTPARCVLYLTAASGHSITLANGTSTGDGYLLLLDDSDQVIDDESVIQFVKLPGGELRMIGSV